nr:ubiquilin [Cryptococcus depauperatus CBS 7841]
MSSETTEEIKITVKGPQDLKLSISVDPSRSVLELKELIASQCDVEKDRQRLIYSGKVLKDEEAIASYKIQNGHTIHMVKGAAKNVSNSGAQPNQTQRLPQMGTGLNVSGNPIDNVENIHHGLAGFNPFAGLQGINNLNDPNAMTNMMNSPEFLQSMADMMSRPEVVDQIIASNPQLASMGPQIRQMMQSPFFRSMMSNPATLRSMMQMQSAMGGQGGLGGMGGFNPFGRAAGDNNASTDSSNPPTDPYPNLFAPSAGAATNNNNGGTPSTGERSTENAQPGTNTGGLPPGLAALLGGPDAGSLGTGQGQFPSGLATLLGLGAAAGSNPTEGANVEAGGNPFGGFDPAMLFGGGLGGGLGGGQSPWGTAPAPRDERPPEEIYATQLGQLNGMGLWDAQKNIRALRATGGNVEAAIELIFSGQLDQ